MFHVIHSLILTVITFGRRRIHCLLELGRVSHGQGFLDGLREHLGDHCYASLMDEDSWGKLTDYNRLDGWNSCFARKIAQHVYAYIIYSINQYDMDI